MPSAIYAGEANTSPVTKRRKVTNGELQQHLTRVQSSRIFTPFRTLGLVSPTPVPFTSIPLGKTTFQITTSVGRCLQTYDLRKGLNLVFLTRPQTPSNITATCAWKDCVFAAWGGETVANEVGTWIFKRGKRIGALEPPPGLKEPVTQILIFGSWIVGCCLTRVEVWKSASYEHYTTLLPPRTPGASSGNTISGGICTLPTYLNKVLVGKQDGVVELWNLSTGKLIYSIPPSTSDCGPVTALQPTPALSLLAIARADGSVVIHDVRLDRQIVRLNPKFSCGVNITSMSFRTDGLGTGEDGRKPGVMATAGSGSGDITLWDLNDGGRVMGVLRGAHNPSTVNGSVSGGIKKVEFLPGQAIMISSGMDNALRSWIFDETAFSPVPRILHSRSGHAAPVTHLGFLPANSDGSDAKGKWLLSAGRDQSLWGWSLRRDGQSTELSQGNVRKRGRKLGILGKDISRETSTILEDLKAPEITCFTCSLNRDGGMGAATGGGSVWANISSKRGTNETADTGATGWESIVTGHKGDRCARTWFWGRKKAGRWAFETGDSTEVKSVTMTMCGTFALVGSAGGSIDMFNLQSGIHRRKFPSSLTPAQAKKFRLRQVEDSSIPNDTPDGQRNFGPGEGRHTKAVTGLVVDSLNLTVISCGLDGKIKFWDFMSGCLRDEIDWRDVTAITASRYHRSSDLLALSCDDLSIRVVDTETKKLVRELWGCAGQINDFCFSHDGRWVVAASMDCVIRVWDLPTGHLIDALRLESACAALAFSQTGEFLATAQANGVGVDIWNNRTLFTHIPTRQLRNDEVTEAIAPTASGEHGQGVLDAAFQDDEEEDVGAGTETNADQLSQDMMTLSLVPKSRWQTLLHLDIIKQRNKPNEPPKAPEKAPFFLPSLEGVKSTTAPQVEESQLDVVERSRISKVDRTRAESQFTVSLRLGSETKNYFTFIEHLRTLSPSAADIEIRSLNPLSQPNELISFVEALTERLVQKLDYELVQAWMSVFLRLHGDVVVHSPELVEALKVWRVEHEKESQRLSALVGYCSGVVGFLRSGRT